MCIYSNNLVEDLIKDATKPNHLQNSLGKVRYQICILEIRPDKVV